MDSFLTFQGMRTFNSETAQTGIDTDCHNIAEMKRQVVLRIRSGSESQGKKYNKSMEITKRSTFPSVRNAPKIGPKKLDSSKYYIPSSLDKARKSPRRMLRSFTEPSSSSPRSGLEAAPPWLCATLWAGKDGGSRFDCYYLPIQKDYTMVFLSLETHLSRFVKRKSAVFYCSFALSPG